MTGAVSPVPALDSPPELDAGVRMPAKRIRMPYEFALLTMALILAWELAPRALDISHVVLPTFSRVVGTLVRELPGWLPDLRVTLVELVAGFAAGALFGLVGGIAIYYSDFLRRGAYPLVTVVRILPKVAFTPLFLVWFGIGMGSKVALAFIGIAFMMLVQTIAGLNAIDPALVELGRSLKMRETQILWRLRLTSALPALLVGVKLSLVYALTMIVLAEMVIASNGLGHILVISKSKLQTDSIMAVMLVIAAIGFALFSAGNLVERRVMRQRREEEPV